MSKTPAHPPFKAPADLPTHPHLLSAPGSAFIHRDLSWIQFNERVLAQATEKDNPLLERLKFLAISSSNLDEFFAIRLASVHRSISQLEKERATPAKISARKQIREAILKDVRELNARQSKILTELKHALMASESPGKLHLVLPGEPLSGPLGSELHALGAQIFQDAVVPHLSAPEPLKARSLTSMGNLKLAAILPGEKLTEKPSDKMSDYRIVRVPRALPSAYWRAVPRRKGEYAIFFLDDLLIRYLSEVFKSPTPASVIRLTRDGDFSVELEEEDSESIPDVIMSGIGRRDHGRPVRLQTAGEVPHAVLVGATQAFRLTLEQVFESLPKTLCLQGLWSATSQLPEDLRNHSAMRYLTGKPPVVKGLSSPERIFARLKKRDVLFHHPYDPFDAFVAWVQASCKDPKVTAIDLTVYRTDAGSPIIEALKKAAASKNIRVIIELRARFDELNNLRLAEDLRKAGVAVFFGFGKLKVHAKIALVTRTEEGEATRLYTHLSTGNYNASTARQYTDLAVITAHAQIGADAKKFFDTVAEGKIPLTFKTLVSAPIRLHRRLLSHIEQETKAALEGKPARILAKVNSLVDEAIIASLYAASNAGVKVDLIVRGACSLIPGVAGMSKNIRVISIVDRYLEHSRIYYFGSADAIYLSSADWMPRNFFSRLEIAFPVLDPKIHAFLKEVVMPTYLRDNARAQELTSKGTWRKRSTDPKAEPLRSQFYLEDLARSAYKGTPLE